MTSSRKRKQDESSSSDTKMRSRYSGHMARTEESFTVFFFSLLLQEDTVHVRINYVKCGIHRKKKEIKLDVPKFKYTPHTSSPIAHATPQHLIYDTLCFVSFFLRIAYVYLRYSTTTDNARRQLRYTKIDTCLDLVQLL